MCQCREPVQQPQIIFQPGDVLLFYGTEHVVAVGNPNGEDVVQVEYVNGIRLPMWVSPGPGISKVQRNRN